MYGINQNSSLLPCEYSQRGTGRFLRNTGEVLYGDDSEQSCHGACGDLRGQRQKQAAYEWQARTEKLMDDCRAGKISLILTKSISRFARSMPDCAAMVQELRQLGVNILFEKENLNSKDEKCTLIFNIFSAIAQEENHSISLHSTLAHEQYILEGKPFGPISFGYRNAGGNRWEINEEEAPRVRKAFHMAEEGKRYSEILEALDALGYLFEHREETDHHASCRN